MIHKFKNITGSEGDTYILILTGNRYQLSELNVKELIPWNICKRNIEADVNDQNNFLDFCGCTYHQIIFIGEGFTADNINRGLSRVRRH